MAKRNPQQQSRSDPDLELKASTFPFTESPEPEVKAGAVADPELGQMGLPNMSDATLRGLRYASALAEQGDCALDSLLLLAGYLTVRRNQRFDSCKLLSELLVGHSRAKSASPVALLGLRERYGISRAANTQANVPPRRGIGADARRVLQGAGLVAGQISRRERVGARHLLAAILAPYNTSNPPVAQTALAELGYDLESLRRAYVEGMLNFKLTEDNPDAWIRLFSEPLSVRVPESPTPQPSATVQEATELRAGIPTAMGDDPAQVDSLGRDGLVNALAAMFAAERQATPFTVALIGDWGSGKSSVLAQIQKRLIDNPKTVDRFDFAYFNAWRYEHVENLHAGLAQEVVAGLVQKRRGWQRLRLAWNFAQAAYRQELTKTLLGLMGVVAVGAAAAWGATTDTLSTFLQSALGVGAGAGLVAFLFYAGRDLRRIFEHPLAAELTTYLRLPRYGQHLGMVPVLRQHVRSLCELCLGGARQRRLLLFVDDLDRCGAPCIVGTLDAIRLAMDIKNVIVVIAMDHRIALKAVADHYKTLADPRRSAEAIARDYLGKIIQLPVRLHQPNEREVAQFIAHDLFAVSTPSSAAPVVEPPAASGTDSKPVLDHTPQEFADTLSGTTRSDRPPSSDQETQLAAPPSAAKERAIARETDTLIAEMTDTEEELKLFQELANSHQFHNPRQLIRLRNSYRLLKILALLRQQVVGVGKIPPDPEHLMAMLFWHEFLYECPREERPRCVAFLWGELSLEEAASGATRRVLATVGQRLRTTFAMETPEEGYTSTIGFVRRLMLPHHDETIVDSRQENTPLAGHRDVAIHSDQGMVRGTDVRAHRQHPRVV